MGYKTLIQSAVQNAIKNTLGGTDGLSVLVVYSSTDTNKSYDPLTRTLTATATQYTGVSCLFVGFSLEDMDDTIKPATDKKALIPALELPVTPKEDDKIIDNGETYTVKKLLTDPASALFILHVRKE